MQLANKHILMFEDNIENIKIQQALLEDEGAIVHLFLGGALDELQDLGNIDLIVMDLMIPGGVDGFEFFQRLQENPQLSSVPVVAVSAMDASLAVSKTKSLGFAGFIAKPVDMDLFPKQVASIIDGKSVWDTNRR